MAGVYDDSPQQATPAPAVHRAYRASRYRPDRGTIGSLSAPKASPEFRRLAMAVHEELRPTGPIEAVLIGGIVATTWRLRARSDEAGVRLDDPETTRAERSLRAGICALMRLRSLSGAAAPSSGPVRLLESPDGDDSFGWRDRLAWDDAVSEDSPIVRGTWITVGQVVSRIIDGWSWANVLRAHPELCEDDLRACLAFTVEDEEGR